MIAIDIGSNSVRLMTADGKTFSEITKLADGIDRTGRLSETGIDRTVETLKVYATRYTGSKIVAFATEAVRRAEDGADFLLRVKNETGLCVKLLSGEEEAKLALAGAVKPTGAVSVCDLGGGSMELISSNNGVDPEYIMSLPLGVVVLKNRYNGDYRKAIDEAQELVKEYGATKRYPLVISGGSACAIAAAIINMNVYDKSRINGFEITAKTLDDFIPMLLSKELKVLRPICSKRADTIPYGAVIIRALLNHMNVDRFTVSDSGNLDAAIKHPELVR